SPYVGFLCGWVKAWWSEAQAGPAEGMRRFRPPRAVPEGMRETRRTNAPGDSAVRGGRSPAVLQGNGLYRYVNGYVPYLSAAGVPVAMGALRSAGPSFGQPFQPLPPVAFPLPWPWPFPGIWSPRVSPSYS